MYSIIYLLFKITEQGFVENTAYEQFSLIGSCYTGACDHMAIICVLLAHQRSFRMNVLNPDDLKGKSMTSSVNFTLQHLSKWWKKTKQNTNFRAWRILKIILEKFEAVGMAAHPQVTRPVVYLNVIADNPHRPTASETLSPVIVKKMWPFYSILVQNGHTHTHTKQHFFS